MLFLEMPEPFLTQRFTDQELNMQLTNGLIKPVFAQERPLGNIGGDKGTGLGPFSDMYKLVSGGNVGPASGALANIISTVIGVITIIAGLWFIFNFMIAAVGMVISAGNEEAIKNNTKKMTQSLLGLVVVIGAYALISLIGLILGINFLALEFLIENVKPQ